MDSCYVDNLETNKQTNNLYGGLIQDFSVVTESGGDAPFYIKFLQNTMNIHCRGYIV